MPDSPPDEHLWPRWLRRGCLGCSVVVALALLAGTCALAFHLHQSASTITRRPPLIALENGCVGAVRARGYYFHRAAYLPSGRLVALVNQPIGLGRIVGTSMSAASDGGLAGTMLRLEASTLLIIGPEGAHEVPIPVGPGSAADVTSISVDPTGGRLVAAVNLWDLKSASYDDEGASPGDWVVEAWLLDLASERWTKLLSLPRGQYLSLLDWLPDGSAVLARPRSSRQTYPSDIWSIDLAGHVRTVARMPRFRDRRLLTDGRAVRLAVLAAANEANRSAGWLLVTTDLSTGKTSSRQVTEIRDVPPSPLSADESLVYVSSRVAALDWRAARMRFFTWPISGSGDAHATPDGAWAFNSTVVGSPAREALLAVNLADRRPHVALARGCYLLAVAPSGASFLASMNVEPSSSLSSAGAELWEVYPDFAALARAPVLKTPPIPPPRP